MDKPIVISNKKNDDTIIGKEGSKVSLNNIPNIKKMIILVKKKR
jgi:hypothetical protein